MQETVESVVGYQRPATQLARLQTTFSDRAVDMVAANSGLNGSFGNA
jgi:hypothetical protein